MLVTLKDGKTTDISNISDVKYIIAEYLGTDALAAIKHVMNEVVESVDCDLIDEKIEDIILREMSGCFRYEINKIRKKLDW